MSLLLFIAEDYSTYIVSLTQYLQMRFVLLKLYVKSKNRKNEQFAWQSNQSRPL